MQPNQYQAGSKPLTAEERQSRSTTASPTGRAFSTATPLLRESGRELLERGVAFTVLTMILADDLEVRYADDCCYLNKDGYALVLDKIIETIAADL